MPGFFSFYFANLIYAEIWLPLPPNPQSCNEALLYSPFSSFQICCVYPTEFYHGCLQKSWWEVFCWSMGDLRGYIAGENDTVPLKVWTTGRPTGHGGDSTLSHSWRNVTSPSLVQVTSLPWCHEYNAFVVPIREGFTALLHISVFYIVSAPCSVVLPEPGVGWCHDSLVLKENKLISFRKHGLINA